MKPQQQTLSVRISDALRRRLENARQLFAQPDGEESVSISEVAKRFLEAAQDEHVEAGELLGRPTATLLNIRRKWERQQSLSRPEWMALGYYLQVGCEELSEDPKLPTAESFAALLEAFVAARALRVGKNLELDHYYLSHLQLDGLAPRSNGAGAVNLEAIPKAASALIRRLRESPSSAPRPVFVGRNLYVVFRDERLKGIEALNEALRPYLPVLFRIAARGHYLREGRPVRSERGPGARNEGFPPVVVGDYRLSIALDELNELFLLIDFGPRRVLYPLSTYPMMREFAALLTELKPGEFWDGRQFFAYTSEKPATFAFRQRGNGIAMVFSPPEWRVLGELMSKALTMPELQRPLEDLGLAYGEI